MDDIIHEAKELGDFIRLLTLVLIKALIYALIYSTSTVPLAWPKKKFFPPLSRNLWN